MFLIDMFLIKKRVVNVLSFLVIPPCKHIVLMISVVRSKVFFFLTGGSAERSTGRLKPRSHGIDCCHAKIRGRSSYINVGVEVFTTMLSVDNHFR